jgi:hypothetical protein
MIETMNKPPPTTLDSEFMKFSGVSLDTPNVSLASDTPTALEARQCTKSSTMINLSQPLSIRGTRQNTRNRRIRNAVAPKAFVTPQPLGESKILPTRFPIRQRASTNFNQCSTTDTKREPWSFKCCPRNTRKPPYGLAEGQHTSTTKTRRQGNGN